MEGKVCFVDGALPGEAVLFEVVKEAPRYLEGVLTEVITPSPDRVEPLCPYYGICGGCQMQHVAYAKELFYKKEQVTDLIGRIAGIRDLKCGDTYPSEDAYHYRTSVTLHRGDGKYGYYRAGSHQVVGIDRCPVAVPAIDGFLPSLSAENGKDDIVLKADHEGRIWSSARSGERFFPDRFRDTDIYLSPRSFSQPNRRVSEGIAAVLEDWIGSRGEGAVFFDAYCGVGFFGFLLRNGFRLRVGMDESRTAIDCAKTTVKSRRIGGFKFYRGDVEKEFLRLVSREKGGKNILLIDPPRKGAGRVFLEETARSGYFDLMYYLSCDPARLARDIKIFTDGTGWALGRVRPFDMFPRTKHIETLAEFVRRDG